jgi:hypothetical protein
MTCPAYENSGAYDRDRLKAAVESGNLPEILRIIREAKNLGPDDILNAVCKAFDQVHKTPPRKLINCVFKNILGAHFGFMALAHKRTADALKGDDSGAFDAWRERFEQFSTGASETALRWAKTKLIMESRLDPLRQDSPWDSENEFGPINIEPEASTSAEEIVEADYVRLPS